MEHGKSFCLLRDPRTTRMASSRVRILLGVGSWMLLSGCAFSVGTHPVTSPSSEPVARAQLTSSWPMGSFLVQSNGALRLGSLQMELRHKSERWATASPRDLALAPGYPRVMSDRHEVKGVLRTDSGNYDYVQDVHRVGAETISWKTLMTGTPAKPTRVLALCITIPVSEYRGQALFFDDHPCVLPWYVAGEHVFMKKPRSAPVRSVRVPLADGRTLVVEGEISPYLQDVRAYGSETFALYLAFRPSEGAIHEAELDLTLSCVSSNHPAAVAYDPAVRKPPRMPRPVAAPEVFVPDAVRIAARLASVKPLPCLVPRGEDFVDPAGKSVNLWGMNLVSFYPDYALADKTVENLARLGVNLARLHHNLRPSSDWCAADCQSLMRYVNDSRTPCLKAWDRFDYLNARLREQGIYLSVSLHGTRFYYPEDVSILSVTKEDDGAWADAMDELNHWYWKKAFDVRKMLPVLDERCFLLNAEFARDFLTHVNPYTGLSYGKDPQVLTVELINEYSMEYILMCGNRFPPYWQQLLTAKWNDYLQRHGVVPFDLYQAQTPAQHACLTRFCLELDARYADRMRDVVRKTGCTASLELSNLWRGDTFLGLRSRTDDVIEDHAYDDPLAVHNPDMFALSLVKSAVLGKPFIIGEFNETENTPLQKERHAERSMIVPAITAYSALQGYAGITWFAWSHGLSGIGSDGWGKALAKSDALQIGQIAGDRVLLDHLRTAGLIFRNRYLQASTNPVTVKVDSDWVAQGYAQLMRGENPLQPGWQAVHKLRKTFEAGAREVTNAEWFVRPPPDPTVSDTGELVRDASRRQLTVAAPKAEMFSGYLDGRAPSGLGILEIPGDQGFATVMMATLDNEPLTNTTRILVSKTFIDPGGSESSRCAVILRGVRAGQWSMRVTRPTDCGEVTLQKNEEGVLRLPVSAWNECELERR